VLVSGVELLVCLHYIYTRNVCTCVRCGCERTLYAVRGECTLYGWQVAGGECTLYAVRVAGGRWW